MQLIGKDSGYAQLRLTSGELRMVPAKCMATVGAVSNPDNQNTNLSKAGRKRWMGKRPQVRGVAMNPLITRMAAAKVGRPEAVTQFRLGANRQRVRGRAVKRNPTT